MIRLFAVAFVLALASTAQAAPLVPLQQPDGIVIQVREHVDRVCVALRMVLASELPPGVPPAGALVE
jgi:type IV secretory pathway component VirB8